MCASLEPARIRHPEAEAHVEQRHEHPDHRRRGAAHVGRCGTRRHGHRRAQIHLREDLLQTLASTVPRPRASNEALAEDEEVALPVAQVNVPALLEIEGDVEEVIGRRRTGPVLCEPVKVDVVGDIDLPPSVGSTRTGHQEGRRQPVAEQAVDRRQVDVHRNPHAQQGHGGEQEQEERLGRERGQGDFGQLEVGQMVRLQRSEGPECQLRRQRRVNLGGKPRQHPHPESVRFAEDRRHIGGECLGDGGALGVGVGHAGGRPERALQQLGRSEAPEQVEVVVQHAGGEQQRGSVVAGEQVRLRLRRGGHAAGRVPGSGPASASEKARDTSSSSDTLPAATNSLTCASSNSAPAPGSHRSFSIWYRCCQERSSDCTQFAGGSSSPCSSSSAWRWARSNEREQYCASASPAAGSSARPAETGHRCRHPRLAARTTRPGRAGGRLRGASPPPAAAAATPAWPSGRVRAASPAEGRPHHRVTGRVRLPYLDDLPAIRRRPGRRVDDG